VVATERLVLFPTWLLLDLLGAGHVEHPWVRTVYISKTTRKNAIVQYLDYQIPVTQLKGPKGNGDMQASKRD